MTHPPAPPGSCPPSHAYGQLRHPLKHFQKLRRLQRYGYHQIFWVVELLPVRSSLNFRTCSIGLLCHIIPFSSIPVQLNPRSPQSLFSSISISSSPQLISVQQNPRSFFRLTVLFCKAFLHHLEYTPRSVTLTSFPRLVPDLSYSRPRSWTLQSGGQHGRPASAPSRYCGAVAGSGVGAGIAYLCGADYQAAHNALPSLPASATGQCMQRSQIAFSVDAGLGFHSPERPGVQELCRHESIAALPRHLHTREPGAGQTTPHPPLFWKALLADLAQPFQIPYPPLRAAKPCGDMDSPISPQGSSLLIFIR